MATKTAKAPAFKAPEFPRNDVEFIRAGFNDACINFTVRFHRGDFDLLHRAIDVVERYNNFEASKVNPVLAGIEGYCRYISFGREGSPVFYFELDEFEKTPVQIHGIQREIIAAFKSVAADEAGVEQDGSVRIWFD